MTLVSTFYFAALWLCIRLTILVFILLHFHFTKMFFVAIDAFPFSHIFNIVASRVVITLLFQLKYLARVWKEFLSLEANPMGFFAYTFIYSKCIDAIKESVRSRINTIQLCIYLFLFQPFLKQNFYPQSVCSLRIKSSSFIHHWRLCNQTLLALSGEKKLDEYIIRMNNYFTVSLDCSKLNKSKMQSAMEEERKHEKKIQTMHFDSGGSSSLLNGI